jgi:Kae1-associated kinase Bud32
VALLKQIINANANSVNLQILEFSKHLAGGQDIVAIAHVDNYSMESIEDELTSEVMLVIRNFQPRIMSYIKTVNEKTVYVFAVDQWVFERDIEMGFLGEAIASKLIFSWKPLFGYEYLHRNEITLKKRLILELIQNLAQNFPELTSRMQIKPQYFLYEVILSRIRVFPLLAYEASNIIKGLEINEVESLNTYSQALRQLEIEGKIQYQNGYVTISKKFLADCYDPKIRLVNFSRNAPRTLFTSLFGTFPQLINIISHNNEALLKSQKISWRKKMEHPYITIDPQKYVFFQTARGLTSLSDKIDIKGFAQKILLKNSDDIQVKPVGGMLNDVYLIKTQGNNGETKVLVKRFKDWGGIKWFPLTLWSLSARGTKPLAITAQSRLAKEFAINEFLRSEGFNVPKILHVSNAERLIFMEFIEGENLSDAIKRVSSALPEANIEVELSRIGQAGEIMAQVHSHGIVLGDTKPENIIVKPDGALYMIDFEQAAQDSKGDKAWDIAVFVYYAGHYIYPLNGKLKAESITKTFIRGYLAAGGDVNAIRAAGARKYSRVFGIFTMWSIISVIANVCKKTEASK